MLLVMVYIALVFLGLALGSFTNALVWRLHQQEKLKEQNKLTKKKIRELSISRGRSMCPHCEHILAWYDLLPLISWLLLRGRCRYCQKPISSWYPFVELLTAISLPISWYFWPFATNDFLGLVMFSIWIFITVLFAALVVYDLRWMTLPNRLIYPLYGAVAGFKVVQIFEVQMTVGDIVTDVVNTAAGMLVLGGLFWIIYQLSNGRWIGGGDVRLGLALGALLGWQKALLNLVTAAYSGCLIILILLLIGRYHKGLKIPFGPFLIFGAWFSLLWGQYVIDWYKHLSGL